MPFVSQFSSSSLIVAKWLELAQRSVQIILRMASNSMSRKLCHSVALCAVIDPACLSAYCVAKSLRFARSESDYLLQLHAKVADAMGACPRVDSTPLCSISAPACGLNVFDAPSGGLSDPPFIVSLLNALELPGPFASLRVRCSRDPSVIGLLST